MRNFSIVVTTLFGVAASAATFGAVQAQDSKTINFISSNDGSCSVYPQFAMQSFGYLEKEGYKVNLLSSDTSVAYVAFLSNGDADVVMLDAAQTLSAVEAGQPIKVVFETHQFAPEGIVVLADSPIQSLSDLKGKKIGLAEQSDETTTQIALDSVGITMQEVTTFVIGNQGPVMAKALNDGQVDAFAGGASDRASLEAQGVKFRNITPDAISRNPGNSLVVWGPTLEEKRPMIRAFVRSWAAAQHAGIYDTKAVVGSCRHFVPEQFEDLELGSKIIINSAYTTQLRRTAHFGELQPNVWAGIQPGYIKTDVISKEIDPSTFLDTSFYPDYETITTDYIREGIEEWKKANPDQVIP